MGETLLYAALTVFTLPSEQYYMLPQLNVFKQKTPVFTLPSEQYYMLSQLNVFKQKTPVFTLPSEQYYMLSQLKVSKLKILHYHYMNYYSYIPYSF